MQLMQLNLKLSSCQKNFTAQITLVKNTFLFHQYIYYIYIKYSTKSSTYLCN